MNSKETIRLRNLSIGYRIKGNDVKVVAHDINASLQSGELTCLIGSNGIGKSTLLRTLSAFQPRLDGDIVINDKNIDEYSDKQLARTIGVVLTTKPDVQNMSVTELVGLGRSPYTGFWGNLSEDDNRIVDEAIVMVNIGNLKHRMIQTLSDGERQKVMIAKALAQQTPVIFLDEPTIGLDVSMKAKIRTLIHELNRRRNTTVILTTHDMGDVDALCRRIVIIDKGKMLYNNDIEHLKGFFGSYRTLKIRLDGDLEQWAQQLQQELPEFSVSADEEWISVLVDEEKQKVIDVLSGLQKKYRIRDMQLEEISTEEVIKKIYEEGVG